MGRREGDRSFVGLGGSSKRDGCAWMDTMFRKARAYEMVGKARHKIPLHFTR